MYSSERVEHRSFTASARLNERSQGDQEIVLNLQPDLFELLEEFEKDEANHACSSGQPPEQRFAILS